MVMSNTRTYEKCGRMKFTDLSHLVDSELASRNSDLLDQLGENLSLLRRPLSKVNDPFFE